MTSRHLGHTPTNIPSWVGGPVVKNPGKIMGLDLVTLRRTQARARTKLTPFCSDIARHSLRNRTNNFRIGVHLFLATAFSTTPAMPPQKCSAAHGASRSASAAHLLALESAPRRCHCSASARRYQHYPWHVDTSRTWHVLQRLTGSVYATTKLPTFWSDSREWTGAGPRLSPSQPLVMESSAIWTLSRSSLAPSLFQRQEQSQATVLQQGFDVIASPCCYRCCPTKDF